MNIAGMGTISNYVNNVKLNAKWQEAKQNPLKNKEQELDPQIAEIKRWKEEQQHSQEISSIHGKMMSGSALTDEELEYLRKNNPDLYEQAVKIKREREEYKKALENCKSKEDVEKLNQQRLHQFATEAKAISSNPNIPKAKKVELLEYLNMRINASMNDFNAFVKSQNYQELPDKRYETDIEQGAQENKSADMQEPAEELPEATSENASVSESDIADQSDPKAATKDEPVLANSDLPAPSESTIKAAKHAYTANGKSADLPDIAVSDHRANKAKTRVSVYA